MCPFGGRWFYDFNLLSRGHIFQTACTRVPATKVNLEEAQFGGVKMVEDPNVEGKGFSQKAT